MCKRNPKCEVKILIAVIEKYYAFKGFYFYDGYQKACTLYSNVEPTYFENHFCAKKDHKEREERLQIHFNSIILRIGICNLDKSSLIPLLAENVNMTVNNNT